MFNLTFSKVSKEISLDLYKKKLFIIIKMLLIIF
jgi:hypothetical protein